MDFRVEKPGQSKTRNDRRPAFPIAGTVKPFGLYPLMAFPVLPGETLQHFETKMRMLSMPIKHPLGGAWMESWLMYVKFTDLDRNLGEMFISEDVSSAPYSAGSASDRYFTQAGQIDWVRLCTERIHNAYFINEDETPRTIDGMRQVKLNAKSFYQNAIFKPADEAVPTTDASDTYEHLSAWRMMQQMSMTELSYEKYLEQFGVQSIRAAEGDPEILRYSRSWTVPVNTVEPSSGAPSSAWVWNDNLVADKPKRFDEPGFIVMLATVRPKMFQKHQRASMLGNMWGFRDWFPVYNLSDPTAGIRELSSQDTVFDPAAFGAQSPAKDMLYDHRDLLSHGEQFINASAHPYPLPQSSGLSTGDTAAVEDLRGEYCAEADVDGMFTSTDAGDQFCYYEGIAQARISGHVTDTTR